MNTAKVILNPFGGRWSKQDKVRRVEQALRTAGIDYDLVLTDAPGHGLELAKQAARENWPVVVAAGGDGTINEVVNGLMEAAGNHEVGPLAILPVGTANDLADMLALPRELNEVCQRIARGRTRLLDVGQVNNRYFTNNSAVGLEPMVSLAHEQMRWLTGNFRYIAAAVKAIVEAKPWQMWLSWDTGTYEGPITLVSVGNSRRTGGVFYMTPKALLDDGLLDFVYGVGMGRWQMLRLLPKTLKGVHIYHPLVTYSQTSQLSILASPATPIQADGEIIETQATKITYRILPGKLRVIV